MPCLAIFCLFLLKIIHVINFRGFHCPQKILTTNYFQIVVELFIVKHVIQLSAINRLTTCTDLHHTYIRQFHYLHTIAITNVALSCMFMYSCLLFVDRSLQEVPSKLRLWMIRVDLINVDDFNDSKFSQRLICWYTNIDSLINKLDKLKSRLKLYFPDIVCILEVFL